MHPGSLEDPIQSAPRVVSSCHGPSDTEFRILSIDGGGIRGIFPAAILAWLERNCLAGDRIGNYFDLIAGTSTGGVIALGLGAVLSASEVLELYLCRGHLVFPPQQRTRAGRLWNQLFCNRYDRRPLDELLRGELGTSRLLDSRYRLLIPATEGRGDPSPGRSLIVSCCHLPDNLARRS